jgi:hypothetical protein
MFILHSLIQVFITIYQALLEKDEETCCPHPLNGDMVWKPDVVKHLKSKWENRKDSQLEKVLVSSTERPSSSKDKQYS